MYVSGSDTHVCTHLLRRCLTAVGHLLGVDATSPSAGGSTTTVSTGRDVGTTGASVRVVSASVHFMVVLWYHFVGDGLLVLFAEQFLEQDDQGQDEGDLAEQQGLSGDQGDFTEDEWQESDHLDFQQHQQLHEHVLALLVLCENGNEGDERLTSVIEYDTEMGVGILLEASEV